MQQLGDSVAASPPAGTEPAPGGPQALAAPGERPSLADTRAVVEEGICRYFADRRAKVPGFVDAHFSLRGSAAMHRVALGWDIAKAPANIALGLPNAVLKLAGAVAGKAGARKLGRRLAAHNLLLKTRVAQEIEWLVRTELLELPLDQGWRVSTRDALAETILSDPRVSGPVRTMLEALGRRAEDSDFRQRLEEAMEAYGGTRAAASEITTGLLTLGAGSLTLHKLTPGAVTLGPALAAVLAQQAAVASFPFGSTLGGLWYGLFPVAPPLALVAGLTGGLMLAAASFAAFAGLVADPLQRRLGLHQKRLLRMLDALERQMLDPAAPAFAVRDHYVARVLDLFDLLGSAYRLAHP